MTWPIDDLTVAGLDAGTDLPESGGGRAELLAAVNKLKAIIAQLNVVDGVCGLNGTTKVELARILRSAAGGVAELGATGKLALGDLILNVANGLLASNAADRCSVDNSSLVLLSTPETLLLSPVYNVWTALGSATLTSAAATHALVRAVCNVTGNNNTTADPISSFRLRTPGEAEPDLTNFVARAYYDKVAASNPNYAVYVRDAGTKLIKLDASYNMEYLWQRDYDTTNNTQTGKLYLVGYVR